MSSKESEANGQGNAREDTGGACASGSCCPLQTRWGRLVWVLLIGFLVYVQWPALKGLYYKATGVAAKTPAVAWRNDYQAALSEAARSRKPVLIDFSASWCPPCQVMRHEVWTDRRVGQVVNAGYVPLLVDVDDPKNAEVTRRYGVQGIPTILVVDARGRVLRQGAFMSRSELLVFLGA